MSKQEKVVCAAIKRVGKDYLDRERVCIDICLQYDDEYSTASYHSERDVGIEFHEEIKGFITNKNRFVDPIEAMKIAVECLQIKEVEDAVMKIAYRKHIKLMVSVPIMTEKLNVLIADYLSRGLKPEDIY